MKSLNKFSEEEALLNAALADESWQSLNSSLKRHALVAMCARNRKRRLRLWAGQAACTAALFTGALWWLGLLPQPAVKPVNSRQIIAAGVAQKSETPLTSATAVHFISETEMLAMFPPGSCVVAEINGQKKLVILDPKIAEAGFTVADVGR